MVTKLFDEPYATVTFNPEKKRLVLVWKGNPSKEEYKKPFMTMIDFGMKTSVDSMLSDITNQGIVGPDSRKWFEHEMMPQAAKAGLKRAAIVTSGNAFKLYYINLILSAVNKFPITTKLFKTQDEAFDWLDTFQVSVQQKV